MCSRSEVADVTGFVKYIRKRVFRHQNVGRGWGGGGGGYGPLCSPPASPPIYSVNSDRLELN